VAILPQICNNIATEAEISIAAIASTAGNVHNLWALLHAR
jgi:hypothetical protein